MIFYRNVHDLRFIEIWVLISFNKIAKWNFIIYLKTNRTEQNEPLFLDETYHVTNYLVMLVINIKSGARVMKLIL